jgi:hypothetical protein
MTTLDSRTMLAEAFEDRTPLDQAQLAAAASLNASTRPGSLMTMGGGALIGSVLLSKGRFLQEVSIAQLALGIPAALY